MWQQSPDTCDATACMDTNAGQMTPIDAEWSADLHNFKGGSMRRADVPSVRLVASDLDGTLLRRDGTISERTRDVLQRVRAAGMVVVLVSARAPDTLVPLADAAGVSGLAICCNGALVYDLDRDAIVRHTTLAVDAVRQLVQPLREQLPGVCFSFRRESVYACEPDYLRIGRVGDDALIADALALCEEPTLKLNVGHPSLGVEELLARVRGLGLDGFEATHSGAPFVEVAAAGVTKAWALESLAASLGIEPEEVIAFGDAPNDLAMLRWAGRGVAVANAHREVLDVVDEVAPSNQDDGVAVTLEALLDGVGLTERPDR